jgi:hypothetical protein
LDLIGDVSENISQVNWTVYGKIGNIQKKQAFLGYVYNAGGERVVKQYLPYATNQCAECPPGTGIDDLEVYERNTATPETYKARKTITFLSEYTDVRYRDYSAIIEAGLAQCTPQCAARPALNTSDADIYIRDATGNVLAVYHYDRKTSQLRWSEQHLYGSARLGMYLPEKSVTSVSTDSKQREQGYLGKQVFELSNHLGNNMVVISDKKIGVSSNGTTIDYYNADVISAQDYYPFGMTMPGRKYSSSSSNYRYGHGGQEKTDEISGAGNHYTAEFWEYDPRLGRRWNIDPVVKPYESGYACFGNNPIWFIDHNGADTTISGSVTAQSEIMKKEGDPDFVPPGVKLESTAKINAKIVDGKFTSVKQEITPKEFESPVLGGMKPAFTRVSNHKVSISEDGLTANLHYEVETQLSNTEVFGQWVNTLWDDGTIQTNVITVTQSVDIVLKINSITTTFDGSSFPESRYSATYTIDTEKKVLTGTVKNTLEQSSYYKAVKSGTFKERNHPQRKKQVLTY